MPHKHKKQKGFTLIELLVTISIIGLISSVVMVTVTKARSKARDAIRLESIRSLLNALSLEYSNNGKFPCHKAYDLSTNSNFIKPLVTDKLIRDNPVDPINSGNFTFGYMTFSTIANGPCGQMLYLDYTTENPITSCIGGGILFNNDHCHVFFPSAPFCPNWQDLDLSGCNLRDRTNDYVSS